jgi:diaminopimelate decarboxylase
VKSLAIKENLGVGKNNHLTLHGIDLVELCNKYGTPLFVFDESSLVESFERFRRAFKNIYPTVIVCYSVKTNNNLAICKILREKGAYAEVSSELDLYAAKKAGFSGDHIIFDGPFKSAEILRNALEEEVLLINVESFTEIERLNNVAKEMGAEQAIGLRVNPFKPKNFLADFHPKNVTRAVYCYPECRFGFSLNDVLFAFKRAKEFKNLHFQGLMMHPYREAVKVLLPFMREIHEKFGIEIKYLNIGGGFNPRRISYVDFIPLLFDLVKQKLHLKSSLDGEVKVADIETIAKSVVNDIKQNLGAISKPTIITEPGRFIVSSAGILLLRVDHTKIAGGHKWVTVDGGTNLIPSIDERHKILIANKAASPHEEMVNIVGPLLYPKDFIGIKVDVPKVSEGDVVAALNCGAYTLSSSTQFLFPRPAAIIVNSKGEVSVIREKETFEDVVRKDNLY